MEDKNRLVYRLRESVRYHEEENSLYLILGYPLKVIVLNPVWRPVFRLLKGGAFVHFREILSLIDSTDSQRIESFLNGLVRKGFLTTRGILKLDAYPYVSMIIPVRNRPDEITACLESLGRLDYPAERLETIVVDDASQDRTPEVISAFQVRLISLKQHRHASFCRNLGGREAKGEILAFVDSDCLADPSWLMELVPAFGDPLNGAVGGMVDAWFEDKGLDRYEKVKSPLNMGDWPRSSREGDRFFYIPSCNFLTRKSLFLKLEGFREDMQVGEDVDLCWRIQDQGYHIEYRPLGRVYHRHRNKIKHFCSRRFDYGTSEPFLQRVHPERVKTFTYALPDIFFWGFLFISIFPGWTLLFALGGFTLLIDSMIKFGRIRRMNIPVGFGRLVLAEFRGYIAFIYHACSFVSRYYLFFIIPFLLFAPLWSAIGLGAHLVTTAVEYAIKKPRLNPLSFLFYFTLDQVSYQAGVWWGCIRILFFGPVNPRLVMADGKPIKS